MVKLANELCLKRYRCHAMCCSEKENGNDPFHGSCLFVGEIERRYINPFVYLCVLSLFLPLHLHLLCNSIV
jgi:hypothetical protein